MLTVKFSDADYNRDFDTFSRDEVLLRAKAIQEAVQDMIDDFESSGSQGSQGHSLLAAGKINEVEGDYAFAARWYKRAIGADPSLHEARARLVAALIKGYRGAAGHPLIKEALEHALILTAEAPEGVFPALVRRRPLSAWTFLGDALRANGRPEAAREAYVKALRVEPKDMFASGHLAVLYLQEGRTEDAKKCSMCSDSWMSETRGERGSYTSV